MTVIIPERLASLIGEQKVTLFLGSGISAASGLPLWTKLSELLIDEALQTGMISLEQKGELEMLSPREVGFLLLHRLSGPDRARFMARHFSALDLNPIHEELRALEFPRIITTNWDCLAEEMNSNLLESPASLAPWRNRYNCVFTHADDFQIDMARRNELDRWVMHLHGVYYRPETVVWTSQQYDELMMKFNIQNFVRDVLRDNAILYIGFGLNDEDHDRIIRFVRHVSPESRENHYAIMPRFSSTQTALFQREKRTNVISYDLPDKDDVKNGHITGICTIMNALRRRVDQTGRRSTVHWGRTGNPTADAMRWLLSDLSPPRGTRDGISVYGTAGHDFLIDHFESIRTFALRGGSVRFLLINPSIAVHLPDNGAQLSILDWRCRLTGIDSNVQDEFEKQAHTINLIGKINQECAAAQQEANGIELRYCHSFPINTICHIGASVFDCPRPVGQLSLQSPQREARKGTREFNFLLSQFDQLWDRFSTPANES